MTDKNHCDVLAETFEAKAKAGLLDVKFFLQRNDEAGPEEVCLEVASLYKAVEDGRATPLNLGDLNWKPATAA